MRRNILEGRTAVYDADLSAYLDSIPHDKLMACVRMRVVDRSVLKLIRSWLQVPVVEPSDGPDGNEPPRVNRRKEGTPPEGQVRKCSGRTWQGGVISPLLANIYLHRFDVKFHRADGPHRWANARLVRYAEGQARSVARPALTSVADDFGILAKYVGGRISTFVEDTIEEWMGLTINRRKTKVVKLSEPKASVDFLGYTFRYDRDLHGRSHRYLNAAPSKKALAKERASLRELTSPRLCSLPIPELIGRINRHLVGWKNYYEWGYSRKACRGVNRFVRERLVRHLRRRSQRPYRCTAGSTWYAELERFGLVYL